MGNHKSKKTIKEEDINTIIHNLPENTEVIVLTGGEIFLEKELLLSTIQKIKEKNSAIKIQLESNGIYLYKEGIKAKEELVSLKEMGVESIRFSDDPFHASGGVDLEKVRALKELEDESTPVIQYLIQDKALAIGRAKNLEEEKLKQGNCMNHKDTPNNPYLFLDVEGNVYICTWKCIPPIGNMIKEDFSTVIERLKEPFNEHILKGEILEAINLINKEDTNSNYIEKNGQCSLCMKTFSK